MKFKLNKKKISSFSSGYWYISWLCLVTLSYLYNCWVIPLRVTFPYQTSTNLITWFVFDYVMDAIYILDLMLIKPRLIYLDDGFWIRDSKLTRIQYRLKLQYKVWGRELQRTKPNY